MGYKRFYLEEMEKLNKKKGESTNEKVDEEAIINNSSINNSNDYCWNVCKLSKNSLLFRINLFPISYEPDISSRS